MANRETAKIFRALFAISAVQLLHDTESEERLKLNFRCFNAVVYEWSDISHDLSEMPCKPIGLSKVDHYRHVRLSSWENSYSFHAFFRPKSKSLFQ